MRVSSEIGFLDFSRRMWLRQGRGNYKQLQPLDIMALAIVAIPAFRYGLTLGLRSRREVLIYARE